MALGTFGELRAAVADALARSDVPTHVYDLAHAEVCTRLRVREMEVTGALSLVAGIIYVDLPTGFKLMRHAYIGGDGTLEAGGSFSTGFSEGFQTSVPNAATVFTKLEQVTGWAVSHEFETVQCPTAFCIIGSTMRFNSTPDEDRTIIYTAVIAPTAMAEDADTNVLLTTFPSLYLYSALRHAAIWAQDIELASAYTSAYESEAARVVKQDRVSRYSGPLAVRLG
jgi:hypothetical protein